MQKLEDIETKFQMQNKMLMPSIKVVQDDSMPTIESIQE